MSASERGPRAGLLRRTIGKTWLRVFGWTSGGDVPATPRAVFVAAPHTTGWDLPFTLAVAWSLDMNISWVGKAELFKKPYGAFFRALGGVPIVRDKKLNQVQRISAAMLAEDGIFLVIAPSGTRTKQDMWKSGFLHIATAADVPIMLAYLDYEKKCGGLGPSFIPSGDLRADMDRVRDFYKDVVAKHPERTSFPRLKEEDLAEDAPPKSGRQRAA